MTRPVIAIDGPAGAGKSTTSRGLARELGFEYVDTGAMYRVVGVVAAERGIDLADERALADLCDELAIVFEERSDGYHVLANGRDLSGPIRTSEAGRLASKVSVVPAVRDRLVAKQRALGEKGGVVMEGRDIGTVVFPEAEVKVFLVASIRERARRRYAELVARGESANLAEVEREIAARDERDQNRPHSPLQCARDAIRVDTTEDPVDGVVARLCAMVAKVWRP